MRLIDCFAELLGYTLEQVGAIRAGAVPDYDELRLGIERRLAERSLEATGGGYSREQYEAAQFAVIAFIDEAVLLSEWPHKERWARELLQRRHFGTANAGAEFFVRLDALSPFDPAERDLREVYYYCLSLGFVGQYYAPGDRSRLEALRAANFKLLTGGEGRVASLRNITLFPEAVAEPIEGSHRVPHRRRTALIYGLPLLALLTTFFVFRAEILAAADYLITVI